MPTRTAQSTTGSKLIDPLRSATLQIRFPLTSSTISRGSAQNTRFEIRDWRLTAMMCLRSMRGT